MLELLLNQICNMYDTFQEHHVVFTAALTGSATGRKTFIFQNFIGTFLTFCTHRLIFSDAFSIHVFNCLVY